MPNDTTTRRTVLRTLGGGLAVATGLTATAGTAAAHFPDELDVTVNPNAEGVVRADADAFAVRLTPNEAHDPDQEMAGPYATRRYYRAGTPDTVAHGGVRPTGSYEGLWADGSHLLVFPMAESGIGTDSRTVELRWEREVGGHHGFSGTDDVTVE